MRLSTPSLLRLALGLALLACLSVLWPADASAQVRANRLGEDECLVGDFTSHDDVIMTAVATHDGGAGDVYQAICDDDDCWGFSINRGAGVNALTTGLTPADYTWYVCAWNGSVRRVVANLSGGAALWLRQPADAGVDARVVQIHQSSVPDSIRRFSARLDDLQEAAH